MYGNETVQLAQKINFGNGVAAAGFSERLYKKHSNILVLYCYFLSEFILIRISYTNEYKWSPTDQVTEWNSILFFAEE